MKFELNNIQRKNLGLFQIESKWECVQISKDKYIYFDGDRIKKLIDVDEDNNYYFEVNINQKTIENRTYLEPNSKGKVFKLTYSNLKNRANSGMYFLYNSKHIVLGNIRTQRTYYNSRMAGVKKLENYDELDKWLEDWIDSTTEKDLYEINIFKDEERNIYKFKEGDFFRFNVDRGLYGYGRIILNYFKLRKEKKPHWRLMGKPLIAKVYHILTNNENVSIDEIKKLKSFPSDYIFDNSFVYGDFNIIGNLPLEEDELDYPISYGISDNMQDRNKIYFQYGETFKSIPFNNDNCFGDFKKNEVGWNLAIDRNILEECIKEGSNLPYWIKYSKSYQLHKDLRHPYNIKIKEKVFEQMEIKV